MWSSWGFAFLGQLWAEAALLVGLCVLLGLALLEAPGAVHRWRRARGPPREGRSRRRLQSIMDELEEEYKSLFPEQEDDLSMVTRIEKTIVGEMALQLDRRILSSIFSERVFLYGYTVRKIRDMMTQGSNEPMFLLNKKELKGMTERYADIMNQLKPLGYDPNVHPAFTEQLVNSFGTASGIFISTFNDDYFFSPFLLKDFIKNSGIPKEDQNKCNILVKCLDHLTCAAGRPFLIFSNKL